MKNLFLLVVIFIFLLLSIGLQIDIWNRDNEIRVLKEIIYCYENPGVRKSVRKDLIKKGWDE